MASNRHLGRIVALQALYEYEVRTQAGDTSDTLEAIVARDIVRYESAIDDVTFVKELADGVVDKQAELDAALQPIAPDWPISQIARVDRTVLRIGLYELLYRSDVVLPKVAINEAVELAKAFGSDNSSRFVNGVLGTAYRTLVKGASDNDETAKEAAKQK